MKATHRSVSPVSATLVSAVKKLRNKNVTIAPDVSKASVRAEAENRSPVNALRAAADSLSAMQKWYMSDLPDEDFGAKRKAALTKPPELKIRFEEPTVISLPKSPVKRPLPADLPVLQFKPVRSLTGQVTDLVSISTVKRTLTLQNTPPVSFSACKAGETHELELANQDMICLLGKQEVANERLRDELREARAELTKWRRAFTTLPADRFDRYTDRLHANALNSHW